MTPNTDPHDSELPASPECMALLERLNAVLDREVSMEGLDENHLAQCVACRESAAFARLIHETVPQPVVVPSELAGRIVDGVLSERRARRRVQWTFGASLAVVAASLLVAGFVAMEEIKPNPHTAQAELPKPPPPVVAEAPPPRFDERVADAGEALASISRKASDQTVTPTKNFLPKPAPVSPPESGFPHEAEPAAETIAEIPHNAKSSIEPVTTSTVRAMNLFLRDTGVNPPTKPKS